MIKRSANFHKNQVQYYGEEFLNLKALMEEQGREVKKWKVKYKVLD
jgi:hypothetical protein